MGERGTRRRRAVRLSDEALQLLRRRLIEEWESLPLEGRLTRVARAGLMDVCVGTSERILNRKGNDRAVLQQAFESVGLKWDERYCEPMPSGSNLALPQDSAEPPSVATVRAPVRENRRPRVVWNALIACVLCSLFAFGTATTLRGDREVPRRVLMIAWKAYHEGRYSDARRHLQEAGELATKAKDVGVKAEVFRLQGEVLAAEGRLTEAVTLYEKALVLRSSFRFDQARSSLLEVLGVAETQLGWFQLAETHLLESYEGLRRNKDWRGVAGTSRSLGSLFAAMGEPAKARAWFAGAREAMKHDPDLQLRTDIKAQEAMLLSEEGKTGEALGDLRECLREWHERGHPRWIATTLFQIAKVQSARGERPEAVAAATEAKRNFERVHDRRNADECARWLAELHGKDKVARK